MASLSLGLKYVQFPQIFHKASVDNSVSTFMKAYSRDVDEDVLPISTHSKKHFHGYDARLQDMFLSRINLVGYVNTEK